MNEASLSECFAARMGQLLGPDFPKAVGLAVSGGGDSMAMLALAHGWARHMGVALRVVTVDHGLREESADEAAMVARECATLGHTHDTLRWHWDGQGNLQDAARRARLDLIGQWRRDLAHVLFAHTRDDVAETFMMRLVRGSGVDGLSAMSARRWIAESSERGFWQVRPLLAARRAALRHYAETLRIPYVDDPSNEDPRFDRVRIRRAISELGLDVEALAETAERMRRAREALEARLASVATAVAREGEANSLPTGTVAIDRDRFAAIERETQLRLLAKAIGWVTGAEYRPRVTALADTLDRALGGAGSTLQGAQVLVAKATIHVVREARAVEGLTAIAGQDVWDGRWHLSGADIDGLVVRALGEVGWRQIGEKPEGAPPHALALSLPAVFDGDRLVACPHFGFGPQQEIRLIPPLGPFVAG